ncbi:MAG: LmbE family protein [Verrucomicrobia bacterium]|nr:LmbE family protein [Verrucomicrobiota bacterium]
MKSAIAIGAHPDDIEFYMAGTLLLLKRAGYKVHYMNIASGNCGSLKHNAARARLIRRKESEQAARILGARYHSSLTDDLEIFYEVKTLRRLAAVIREANPAIILTHSPQDYMEDHTNTCRLVVTAAFARGMPNFKTVPSRDAVDTETTIYHAMPHGLQDGLRQRVTPGAFVNTTLVHRTKRDALAAHRSQKEWLDVSQGMDSYLRVMEEMSLDVGRMSRRFKHAEGWRRHLHLGFSATDQDPLRAVLKGNYLVNASYETNLPEERRGVHSETTGPL